MAAVIQNEFNSMSANIPLAELDYIKLTGYHAAVSFDSIIETGKVYIHPPVEDGDFIYIDPGGYNMYVDWYAEDAYTNAVANAMDNTRVLIQNHPELQALLVKDEWSMTDRYQWERTVSDIVSAELTAIPGLHQYRTTGDVEGAAKAGARASSLNGLSSDIEAGTIAMEYDCEQMSVTEGVVIQAIENEFLQPYEGRGLKEPSRYFYATSDLGSNGPQVDGAHAFIISSASAAIIEATSSVSSHTYQLPVSDEYRFKDFAAGMPAVMADAGRSIGIYGDRYYTPEFGTVEARSTLIDQGRYSELQTADFPDINLLDMGAARTPLYIEAENTLNPPPDPNLALIGQAGLQTDILLDMLIEFAENPAVVQAEDAIASFHARHGDADMAQVDPITKIMIDEIYAEPELQAEILKIAMQSAKAQVSWELAIDQNAHSPDNMRQVLEGHEIYASFIELTHIPSPLSDVGADLHKWVGEVQGRGQATLQNVSMNAAPAPEVEASEPRRNLDFLGLS